MHHNSTKVIAPPGGKTSISFGGEPVGSAPLKSTPGHGSNKCQVARNQSNVFTVGSEGLGMHYNPHKGKRQESTFQFGGDEKVDVRSSIKTQSDAHQSHVFDGPEPTPQPKQAVPQPKQAIPRPSGGTKEVAASQETVSKQVPVPDKPAPQSAKKPAELQPKAESKPVEEPKPREHVKTSVQILAPPGGSSSIVFG